MNHIIPLVDVTPEMGAFHLDLNSTQGVRKEDIVNCPIVFGTTTKGDGIMYMSNALHRGGVCRGEDRPALFYTYMYQESAEEDAYLNGFGYVARKDQEKNAGRVVALSREHRNLAGFVTTHDFSAHGSLNKNEPEEVTTAQFWLIMLASYIAFKAITWLWRALKILVWSKWNKIKKF